MSRKKKEPISFVQMVQKLKRAGISGSPMPNRLISNEEQVAISDTIKSVLGITEKTKKGNNRMMFFVMYDIESNKVRTLISKYLERKGCIRIQKSIFLADLDRTIFEEIRSDLVEVQSSYENNDSIILVPISTDYLQSMKIIGQSVNVDIITKNKNTLFF